MWLSIILKKIISFNFTFFNKSYYYYTPNVLGLILCCRLKLNNRAIKIIVHIRTLLARHHPDWKKIALCSLNIKPKGKSIWDQFLLTTLPPWLSLFRQKVLNLLESTLQLSLKVSNWTDQAGLNISFPLLYRCNFCIIIFCKKKLYWSSQLQQSL